MSEIKGQLLGLILVLGLFAAIAGSAYAIFNATVNSVVSETETATGVKPTVTPITYGD